jgi:hypothetical protein
MLGGWWGIIISRGRALKKNSFARQFEIFWSIHIQEKSNIHMGGSHFNNEHRVIKEYEGRTLQDGD